MNEANSSSIVRFGRWFAAVVFMISAPISGYFLFQIYLTARASEAWPSVAGDVINADVGMTAVGRYYPNVSYTYIVGGREYVGNRIRASDGEFNIRDAAEQAIQGLAPGKRVEVHYDPSEPGRSVIHPGAGFQEHALLLVPVVMFAIGIATIMRLRRSRD